jgi:hypothetical protein
MLLQEILLLYEHGGGASLQVVYIATASGFMSCDSRHCVQSTKPRDVDKETVCKNCFVCCASVQESQILGAYHAGLIARLSELSTWLYFSTPEGNLVRTA